MKKTVLFLALVTLVNVGFAQVDKFKALLIYQTSMMTKFPAAKESGDFVIGVYKSPATQKALAENVSSKQINGRNIVVKEIKSEGEAAGCNLVFVPSANIASFVGPCKSGNTLLYSEDQGTCAKGAHVSFFIGGDSKPKFEISEGNLKGAGLTAASKLVDLGVKI